MDGTRRAADAFTAEAARLQEFTVKNRGKTLPPELTGGSYNADPFLIVADSLKRIGDQLAADD